jgi:PEP-CTERM motif
MRMKVHSSLVIGAAATAGLLATSSAMGASIGVNFSGGGGGGGNDPALDQRDLLPTQAAGVVPSTAWNNSGPLPTGTLASLVSDAGPTGASVTWAANGVWTAHDTPVGSTGDQVLTNGYLDDTAPAPDPQPLGTTIDFTNLPFIGPYDIYVYYGSDGNDRTGTISATNSATVYNIATNTNPFDGTFTLATPEADGNTDNGEYALFQGVTGNSVTITAARGSNNIGIHGVQLVGTIPEPASLGLLGLGALGLLARRRRRA